MFGRARRLVKDPDEVLDYRWDWGTRLIVDEVLSTSEFLIGPGITHLTDTHTQTTATVWLSGGTIGENYRVTNRVTTNQGRTYDWTIIIMVRQR